MLKEAFLMGNKSGVYSITCYGNDKFYIGSSVNLNARRSSHFSQLKNNKHTNKHLQNAYNKYGECSFVFDVIEYCNENEITRIEQKWLDFFKPYIHSVGMNNSPTACNKKGFKHSEETKKKLSILAKMRSNAHLREYSEKLRGKPSLNKGKKLRKWTEEEKLAASQRLKGRKPWNKGVPHTQETIEKIRKNARKSQYSVDQVTNCVKLRNNGKSFNEISFIMDIPLATVFRLIRTYEKVKKAS